MIDPQRRVVSGAQLWQWRNTAREAALAADVSPVEVDWLLKELAELDSLALRLESFKDWPQIQLKMPLEDLTSLWQQRLDERLPVQYIAEVAPWRHFKVTVSPAVLIPRPETECLIDLAVAACRDSWNTQLEQGHWADLGTGSGVIALGLADAFPEATVHAVELSPTARAIAQMNAENLSFADRIHFYQGSWWEPLETLKGQMSGMVANPPYIPGPLVPQLQPEVANHEPHLALDGGWDGLDCIRHLVETSPAYLKPGAIWLIEMMAGQSQAVRDLLQKQGSYNNIRIHADLAGIDRFALAYRQDE